MSLHDSPLANAQIRKSVLQMLTAAVHVPAYAKDLINRAGRAVSLLLVTHVGFCAVNLFGCEY